MFKIFKFIFIVKFLQNNKLKLISILISIFSLFVIQFIFNDIKELVSYQNKYILVLSKWILILILIYILSYNLYKIIFDIKQKISIFISENEMNNKHKKQILKGDTFLTKGDIIKKKYKCHT